jgi:hypothetical protein
VQETAYQSGKLPKMTPFVSPLGFLNLVRIFNRVSDVMAEKQNRTIHQYSVVAKARFVAEQGSKYTGIFQGAAALVRLSLANPASFTPGISLKFFLDGAPSVNMVAMHDQDGQGTDHNFFKDALSNDLPPPRNIALRLLEKWFQRSKRDSRYLDPYELASWEPNGRKVDQAVSPVVIRFVPTDTVRDLIPSASQNDFRQDLMDTLQAGMTLYAVEAVTETGTEKIGSLVLESGAIASSFGDRLFFRHPRNRNK